MLPQFGPLEGWAADTMRGHHETGSLATPVVNIAEGREAQVLPSQGLYGHLIHLSVNPPWLVARRPGLFLQPDKETAEAAGRLRHCR